MRTNYKKLYGITLQDAKRLCVEFIGHLPRPGYEVCIVNSTMNCTMFDFESPNMPHDCKLYLCNRSGQFYLRQWVSVNVNWDKWVKLND